MIEIIELDSYPTPENSKYPEELCGKIFCIKGILSSYNYIVKDGSTYYYLPDELAVELNDDPKKEPSISMVIEDLIKLKDKFSLDDIIRLRSEGLI